MEENLYPPPPPMLAGAAPPANQQTPQLDSLQLWVRRRADERTLIFLHRIRQEVMNTSNFKQQHLPRARIKKIMRTNDIVKCMRLSADSLVFFEKACYLFISDLTVQSTKVAEYDLRKILTKEHISSAASQFKKFDFLRGVFRRDEVKDVDAAATGQLTTAGTELNVGYDQPPVAGVKGCVADGQLLPANVPDDGGDNC